MTTTCATAEIDLRLIPPLQVVSLREDYFCPATVGGEVLEPIAGCRLQVAWLIVCHQMPARLVDDVERILDLKCQFPDYHNLEPKYYIMFHMHEPYELVCVVCARSTCSMESCF